MARVRIELPDTFGFSTKMAVRVHELNYGAHLGFDGLTALFHEARIRFLAEHGFTEFDAGGAGFLMTDASLILRAEIRRGEALRIEVAVDRFTRTGCDFAYRASRAAGNEEVGRARTGMVFYDYEQRKVVKVPESFRSAVAPTP
jgi:acyl-CoA thioesterase FadM